MDLPEGQGFAEIAPKHRDGMGHLDGGGRCCPGRKGLCISHHALWFSSIEVPYHTLARCQEQHKMDAAPLFRVPRVSNRSLRKRIGVFPVTHT